MSDTPQRHVSFSAFPIGAWLIAIAASVVFYATSPHPERMAITQIFIAGSLAVATLAGTLYGLVLLLFKRYPTFKRSFVTGILVTALAIGAAVAAYYVWDKPLYSLAAVAGYTLVSALVAVFMPRLSKIMSS